MFEGSYDLWAMGGLAGAASCFAVASRLHRRRMRWLASLTAEPLAEPVTRPVPARAIDAAVVMALPLFDAFLHGSRLDPAALRAIRKLHSAQELPNLGEVSTWMRATLSAPDSSADGARPFAYDEAAGRELAFERLRAEGHDVDAPDVSAVTYEAIVDGSPARVIISPDPLPVGLALERDPQIHVYAGSEMARVFGADPRVTILEGVSSREALRVTHETLSSLDELGATIDRLPLLALGLAAVRGGWAVARGRKTVATAIEHALIDTAAAGLGGWLGARLGLTLGLYAAPPTGGGWATLALAFFSTLGALGGAAFGRAVGDFIKGRPLRRACERLLLAAELFRARSSDEAGRGLRVLPHVERRLERVRDERRKLAA